MRHVRLFVNVVCGVVLGLAIGASIASVLTVPHVGKNTGDVIQAVDWNENFGAISTWGNGNIDDSNIANGGITGSTKLADVSVTLGKMAVSSVDSTKIVNGTILAEDILAGTITGDKVAATTISATNMAPDSVTTTQILNGTILGTDISLESGARDDRGLLQYVSSSGKFTWEANCSMFLQLRSAIDINNSSFRYYSFWNSSRNSNENGIDWTYNPISVRLRGGYVRLASASSTNHAFGLRDDGNTISICSITAGGTTCTMSSPSTSVIAAGSKLTFLDNPSGSTGASEPDFYASVCLD